MIMNQQVQFNTCKIHRWIMQAILADVDSLKFAFIGRRTPGKTEKHVVLQTFMRNTKDFAHE